ncbi:hypothetical protein BST61_g5349 [Cercospora zeina]
MFGREFLRLPERHPQSVLKEPYWHHIAPSSFVNQIVGCTVSDDRRSLLYHYHAAGRSYEAKQSDKIRAQNLPADWDNALREYWARIEWSFSWYRSGLVFYEKEAVAAAQAAERNDSVIGLLPLLKNREEDVEIVDLT